MDAVLKLLQEKNLAYIPSGRDFLIQCLNPEHPDKNPSCRVDKITGVTHCFACGFKTNLFKYYGILTNNSSIRIAKLKDKLTGLRNSMTELDLPVGAKPWNEKFRGISLKTLKHFGAFKTSEIEDLTNRIIFPIKDVADRTVVFQARHTLSNVSPKYVFYPRHLSVPMYPVKLDDNYSSLVIVEGIFDMLNLYDKGLHNVSCVFGTQGLTEKTAAEKLLPFKVQGITKIFILFDNDEPGIKAAKELKPILQNLNYETEILYLPESTDPGDLSEEDVQSIIEYVQ